mmetsp:Transcript_46753/g.111191  ORF Transcript_46753/g.111191 Transcript_46753/m.111191 type:complete len:958 (+) Transcript_46753:80-2953(+)
MAKRRASEIGGQPSPSAKSQASSKKNRSSQPRAAASATKPQDDDSDDCVVVSTTTFGQGSTQLETQASQSQSASQQENPERWFLGLGTKIVGRQHYNGIVSDKENVVLRRQPTNPYDGNAIQVLNIREQQIGHLPRELSAVLAPVMDNFLAAARQQNGEELRFEGHIPRGASNTFSMPMKLQVFGNDPQGRLAPRLRDVGTRLRTTYCAAARGSVEVQLAPDEGGTPVADLDEPTWRNITGGRVMKKSAQKGPSAKDVIERELEGIFREGCCYEEALQASQPKLMTSMLYPHQLKALHWMLQQERAWTVEEALQERGTAPAAQEARRSSRSSGSSAGPAKQYFFWIKESGPSGAVYKNLATNSAFQEAPKLPKGGILADDMGLGKTITTLALILSDADEGTSSRSSRGRNLVICPLTVMYNWQEQLRRHAPKLRVRCYHGPDRDRAPSRFAMHDVTLTTYDVVRAEAKDGQQGLGSVSWHRAVLDEAHVIKNHRSATAQALFKLIKADRRWCLTGTPIQNSVEDIYSLARFLQLEPFDKQDWFNRTIVRPLKNQDVAGFERLQVLLRTWCLRRTKDMKVKDPLTGVQQSLLQLPEKSVEVVKVPLSPTDRALYDNLFGCARERVKELEERSELGKQFSLVLLLLTRLRQLCCAPSLLPQAMLAELRCSKSDAAKVMEIATAALGAGKVESLLRNLADAQQDECSICMELGCDCVTRCGHCFHKACLEESIAQLGRGGVGSCPLCRTQVRASELLEKPPELEVEDDPSQSGDGQALGTSSKVLAAVSFLQEHIVGKSDSCGLGKPRKAVVFSQFTQLLGLVQAELKGKGVPFVRLDGSMAHDARVEALQSFDGHAHIQVILCSLKAAGTGLNLTAADHVLLLDPWWNPAVEDQAIDRLHRLGQQRPVRALRFVAERTVEERILGVQDQKRQVIEGALSRKSREELQQIRLKMVSSIFD